MDRSYIRHEIFKFPKKKVWLERLLHPPVNEQVLKALSCSSSPYIILESPLLLETQQYKLVDRILLVDLQERLQILRVKKRDGTRSDVVGSIIKSQMPREEKVRFANDIIKNDITVSFGKGEDNLAGDAVGVLRERGFDPKTKTHVHPSTLKAFVKERITDGKPIDLDLFGAFISNTAVIKRKA